MKPKWKMNILGGIWLYKKASIRFSNENINADLYINILKERKYEMSKIFRKGYILMRDNAPFFIIENTIEIIKRANISEWEEWPAYSPYLNPLKNVWRLIKYQMMNKEINKILKKLQKSKMNTMK